MSVESYIETYLGLIRRDHHKDKDCHFSIAKCWSYGKLNGYEVRHNGYCHRENDAGVSKYFDTYAEAEHHLKNLLAEWIEEESEESNDS